MRLIKVGSGGGRVAGRGASIELIEEGALSSPPDCDKPKAAERGRSDDNMMPFEKSDREGGRPQDSESSMTVVVSMALRCCV